MHCDNTYRYLQQAPSSPNKPNDQTNKCWCDCKVLAAAKEQEKQLLNPKSS